LQLAAAKAAELPLGLMVMYTSRMRRIQIYIEEQLDERLGSEAARAGVSKAALIREAVALRYGGGDPARLADPLDGLVGALDVEPGKVEDMVYGPGRGATADGPRQRPKR
jgi:Ribbon-helix-helix protein, copG family